MNFKLFFFAVVLLFVQFVSGQDDDGYAYGTIKYGPTEDDIAKQRALHDKLR